MSHNVFHRLVSCQYIHIYNYIYIYVQSVVIIENPEHASQASQNKLRTHHQIVSGSIHGKNHGSEKLSLSTAVQKSKTTYNNKRHISKNACEHIRLHIVLLHFLLITTRSV